MSRYRHLPKRAAILAFEGPDRYSLVGGLGTRVTELGIALDDAGIDTDLFFIGDPTLEPVETRGRAFTLRRWCQWISAYHPGGVYDGEPGKIADYATSVPAFLIEHVVRPASARGERLLVLAEDWQVVPAVYELHDRLTEAGLREYVTIAWNANNTYGFERIDFARLERSAHVTAVSRYMKFELAQAGASALVIPNGIPERIFAEVDAAAAASVRRAFGQRRTLLKVGRFDPDKRWMQAVEAVGALKQRGVAVQLLMRGGREAYGETVLDRAEAVGLTIEDVTLATPTMDALIDALAKTRADVVNLRSFLPDALLFTLYGAVDAVLANSGKEPFGLVGLEVMAAGGVAVCGSTGEDYARAFQNAIVCDTGDALELCGYLEDVFANPQLRERMLAEGAQTARAFTWPHVLEVLDAKAGAMHV